MSFFHLGDRFIKDKMELRKTGRERRRKETEEGEGKE